MSKILSLKKGDRILVCRTDRIGDLILTIPLIESIKNSRPECQVDVIASDYAAPVLENNGNIDNIIAVNNTSLQNNKEYCEKLSGDLLENKYKAALIVFPDKVISKIIYNAKIPIRIGTARRFQSIYFNRFLFHSRKANKKHESEYNLDFLKFFRQAKVNYIPHIFVNKKEIMGAKNILSDSNISGRFIVLHPGSGGSADCWPLGHFIELYYILKEQNYSVVLTGSIEEKEEINKFADNKENPLVNLAGKTDIRTLAGLLSLADVVVANSTGPLHLAAAVGTRVIGLYPNSFAMSPVRWGPLGKGHRVILPPEGENDMTTISTKNILKSIDLIMSKSEVSE